LRTSSKNNAMEWASVGFTRAFTSTEGGAGGVTTGGDVPPRFGPTGVNVSFAVGERHCDFLCSSARPHRLQEPSSGEVCARHDPAEHLEQAQGPRREPGRHGRCLPTAPRAQRRVRAHIVLDHPHDLERRLHRRGAPRR
jgi:hypothetical protein